MAEGGAGGGGGGGGWGGSAPGTSVGTGPSSAVGGLVGMGVDPGLAAAVVGGSTGVGTGVTGSVHGQNNMGNPGYGGVTSSNMGGGSTSSGSSGFGGGLSSVGNSDMPGSGGMFGGMGGSFGSSFGGDGYGGTGSVAGATGNADHGFGVPGMGSVGPGPGGGFGSGSMGGAVTGGDPSQGRGDFGSSDIAGLLGRTAGIGFGNRGDRMNPRSDKLDSATPASGLTDAPPSKIDGWDSTIDSLVSGWGKLSDFFSGENARRGFAEGRRGAGLGVDRKPLKNDTAILAKILQQRGGGKKGMGGSAGAKNATATFRGK